MFTKSYLFIWYTEKETADTFLLRHKRHIYQFIFWWYAIRVFVIRHNNLFRNVPMFHRNTLYQCIDVLKKHFSQTSSLSFNRTMIFKCLGQFIMTHIFCIMSRINNCVSSAYSFYIFSSFDVYYYTCVFCNTVIRCQQRNISINNIQTKR